MFFIYDANGELFGNPEGYKSHSIASGITTRKRTELWTIYDSRKDKTNNILFSITTHKP